MAIPDRYTPELIQKFTDAGYWSKEIIPDYVDKNAAKHPDKTAYIQGDNHYTWAEYKLYVDRLALSLVELGIKKDDKFAVYLPDWVETHIFYDALSRIGAVTLAVNIGQRAKEVEYMLNLTEAVGIVTPNVWRDNNYVDMMRELRPRIPGLKYHLVKGGEDTADTLSYDNMVNQKIEERYPDDYLEQYKPGPNEIFLMNFSSGTTGMPKCVPHTPNRWTYFVNLAIDGGRLTGDDVILALVPNNSGFGLWTSHVCPIMLGTKTILLEKFNAEEALKLIEKEKVTMVTAVTTQFVKMLEVPDFDKYDLSSWRVMFTGGQDVPYERVKELESRTNCTVLQFYGSVETGGISRTVLGETLEQRSKTVGKPVPEMNMKLFDPATGDEVIGFGQSGEVACLGPSIGCGYYKDTVESAKLYNDMGWVLTGDLGMLGEDGYLRLVGRVKDIIIRGGQNISAAEVEDAIHGFPKVADVAVVAMPDRVFGEKSCAYVVPKPGQIFTLDELVAFLMDKKMAKYKLPERLEFIDELPLSPGGKVKKNTLREDVAKKLKAEGKV